jgi:hypothetical protein
LRPDAKGYQRCGADHKGKSPPSLANKNREKNLVTKFIDLGLRLASEEKATAIKIA